MRPLEIIVLEHVKKHDLHIMRREYFSGTCVSPRTEPQTLHTGRHQLRRVLIPGFVTLLKVSITQPFFRTGIEGSFPHARHAGADKSVFGDKRAVRRVTWSFG